jgi:hypothetical protein
MMKIPYSFLGKMIKYKKYLHFNKPEKHSSSLSGRKTLKDCETAGDYYEQRTDHIEIECESPEP